MIPDSILDAAIYLAGGAIFAAVGWAFFAALLAIG